MRIRGAAAVVVGAATMVAVVACGSTDAANQEVDPEAPPTTVDLNPTTSEVPAQVGEIGGEYVVGGVATEIVDVAAFQQSQLNGAQIVVEVRSENRSGELQRNPNLTLRCSDRAGDGDWAGGSTWEPTGLVAVNAVLAGEVILAFPLSGPNVEYRSVTCANPAIRLRFEPDNADAVVYDVPIDTSVIDAALRAPTGALQPLPYDAG